MKIYFIRKIEEEFVIEVRNSKIDDCNKEVFRGKEAPKWLNKLQEGVNLFHVQYSEKGDCYVL